MTLKFDFNSCIENPESFQLMLGLLTEDFPFLRSSYPEFENWFFNVVVPGIAKRERTILIEKRQSSVAGILILKHTSIEKKICTLRVRPEYESLGLGVRLFEKSFDILETEKPLLSVSERNYPKFSKIFNHFKFSHSASYKDIYLPCLNELSFNGFLSTKEKSYKNPTRKFYKELSLC